MCCLLNLRYLFFALAKVADVQEHFLAVGPMCHSIPLLTPSGPGPFFGLRFLMAEFSSEIFRVLFIHGLGIFSCFSSSLSFSFMSPSFLSVKGRVLSFL